MILAELAFAAASYMVQASTDKPGNGGQTQSASRKQLPRPGAQGSRETHSTKLANDAMAEGQKIMQGLVREDSRFDELPTLTTNTCVKAWWEWPRELRTPSSVAA